MTLLEFVLYSLATAYISYVIVNTDGLGGMFKWVRAHDPIKVTHCIWCFSVWVALAGILADHIGQPFTVRWMLEAFAVSGGAICLLAYSGAKHL